MLFELCVPINAGVVVVDSGLPKAPVGPIAETEGPDGPSIMPGPTSGVSIRRMTCRERVTGLEVEDSHPRQQSIRWRSKSSRSVTCSKYIIREEILATNSDVEESPLGNTCSPGDRVWKPVVQCRSQTQIESLPPQGTHEEGGSVFVQLVTYSDQLIQTHKPQKFRIDGNRT